MKLLALPQAPGSFRSAAATAKLFRLLGAPPPQQRARILAAKRLSHHSAAIERGDGFIALNGHRHNGWEYVPAVIARVGFVVTSATVKQRLYAAVPARYHHKLIFIAATRGAAAFANKITQLAAAFYDHPSTQLHVTAITGTNGKTSLTWILEHLLLALGYATGVLGTISTHCRQPPAGTRRHILRSSINTTPHPVDIQHSLAVMRAYGVRYVFMEATSHGLEENRLAEVALKSALFSNLSHDHLDYHLSLEAYLKSKLKLLHLLEMSPQQDKRCLLSLHTLKQHNIVAQLQRFAYKNLSLGLVDAPAVPAQKISRHDKDLHALLHARANTVPAFLSLIGAKHKLYSFTTQARTLSAAAMPLSSQFALRQRPLTKPLTATACKLVFSTPTSLLGLMNGENLALALLETAACMNCQSLRAGQELWRSLAQVLTKLSIRGRMETIILANPTVLIDYAHTPAALEAALSALKTHSSVQQPDKNQPRKRPLYVLFGCGGDRDRDKRPLMGKIAYALADGLFLSSDNTRSEAPEAILNDINKGITPLIEHAQNIKPYQRIRSRRAAIAAAVTSIPKEAVLLIAGKGHEHSEFTADGQKVFNEPAIIRAAYKKRTTYAAAQHRQPQLQFSWEQVHNVLAAAADAASFPRLMYTEPQLNSSRPFQELSTDTRTLPKQQVPHSLFIALSGTQYDAAAFIPIAVSRGVRHFIVTKHALTKPPVLAAAPPAPTPTNNKHHPAAHNATETLATWLQTRQCSYIGVHDPTRALGQLAAAKLRTLPGLRVAITGSAGKTSATAFLKTLLSSRWRVYSRAGNFNNAIGVPLAILGIKRRYDCYLFEAGMNAPGELSWLSELIRPHCTIITNILPAHFGVFGSLQQIARAKTELLLHQCKPLPLRTNSGQPAPTQLIEKLSGCVFYPQDIHAKTTINARVRAAALKSCTIASTAHSTLSLTSAFQFSTQLNLAKRVFTLRGCKPFAAALAPLGSAFSAMLSLPPSALANALAAYTPPAGRTEIIAISPKNKRQLILNDAYNANPASMSAFIHYLLPLTQLPQLRELVLVLGDMLELGTYSNKLHRTLGKELAAAAKTAVPAKLVIYCYGSKMVHVYRALQHQFNTRHYAANAAAALSAALSTHCLPQTLFAFKASHGMQLSAIIQNLQTHHSTAIT